MSSLGITMGFLLHKQARKFKYRHWPSNKEKNMMLLFMSYHHIKIFPIEPVWELMFFSIAHKLKWF